METRRRTGAGFRKVLALSRRCSRKQKPPSHPRGWKMFVASQTLLTWTISASSCVRACVRTRASACQCSQLIVHCDPNSCTKKNKKVFRLYSCYFTKSISLCHFGLFFVSVFFFSLRDSTSRGTLQVDLLQMRTWKWVERTNQLTFLSCRLAARQKITYFFFLSFI